MQRQQQQVNGGRGGTDLPFGLMTAWIFEGLGNSSVLFLPLQFSLFLPLVFLFCRTCRDRALFLGPTRSQETTEHQKPLGSAFAIRDSKLKIEDP